MILKQLWKTGLAVMFGFTLTLSTIGCGGDAGTDNGGEAPVATDVEAGSGTEEVHEEGDGHDHAAEEKKEAPAPAATP